MISLVADVNIQGHVSRLVARMLEEEWRDFWNYLDLRYLIFADLGLTPTDTDVVVWQRCHQFPAILLTNNRNDDGPDSLEATIRNYNSPMCLPVFTIGDADSILVGSSYADRVIDRLLRYMLELDNLRGTGRLFLP